MKHTKNYILLKMTQIDLLLLFSQDIKKNSAKCAKKQKYEKKQLSRLNSSIQTNMFLNQLQSLI